MIPTEGVPTEAAPTRRPSPSGIWVGLGVVAVGLAAIVLAWGLVASAVEVHDQVVALVGAGVGGLAVVIVGLALVNAAVARREEDDHRRQLAALVEVLEELRAEEGR